MNTKKAKAIRRMAKEAGHYKAEPDYQVIETKKVQYVRGADGEVKAQEVVKHTIINANRTVYRNMKKAFYRGEFEI